MLTPEITNLYPNETIARALHFWFDGLGLPTRPLLWEVMVRFCSIVYLDSLDVETCCWNEMVQPKKGMPEENMFSFSFFWEKAPISWSYTICSIVFF